MSTKVKICGITQVEDALTASDAGADAIGMVFYKKSARNLENLSVASEIVSAVGPFATTVGLFVDAESSFVQKVLNDVPLQLLQFHGNEDEKFCAQFGRPFIKALRMKEDLDLFSVMAKYPSAMGFLLDAYVPGVPGGTGERFDWARFPKSAEKPVILAGGLTPENAQAAAKATQAYALDVSGGVEASPGIKDPEKIRRFIRQVKLES